MSLRDNTKRQDQFDGLTEIQLVYDLEVRSGSAVIMPTCAGRRFEGRPCVSPSPEQCSTTASAGAQNTSLPSSNVHDNKSPSEPSHESSLKSGDSVPQ